MTENFLSRPRSFSGGETRRRVGIKHFVRVTETKKGNMSVDAAGQQIPLPSRRQDHVIDKACNGQVVFKVECSVKSTARTRNEVAAYKTLQDIHAVSFLQVYILMSLYSRSAGQVQVERIRIMKEMHDKGVAHWGIKPDKIHLPRSGKLRPDLELAHPLDHSPKEPIEGDSGTPAFITGENLAAIATASNRSRTPSLTSPRAVDHASESEFVPGSRDGPHVHGPA
ncbi:hypothetical protein V8E55_005322 [Tylopilus felleus]